MMASATPGLQAAPIASNLRVERACRRAATYTDPNSFLPFV